MLKWLFGGRGNVAAPMLLTAMLVTVLHVPAALAFPYQDRIGNTRIYSEQPIDPRIGAVVARADALLATSPINEPGVSRAVVLTEGGWRWRVMALESAGAFAVRRPFGHVLVFNKSDIAADRVWNGRIMAGERTLSGTIAHETIHLLVARHFGELRARLFPDWKNEGYADFVARESSLKSRDVVQLRKVDPNAPALRYYEARRRVATELARNGGSVERLFN